MLGPSIPEAMVKSSRGFAALRDDYILRYRSTEIGFDHSAFAFLKQCLRVKYKRPELTSAQIASFEYPYAIAAVVILITSFWFRLRHLPVTNQFMAYVAFSVLLPFTSHDYTLIHVHLSFAVFILFLVRDFGEKHVCVPRWLIFFILFSFAIIFTPQSYLLMGIFTGFGAQVKTLALIAMICLVMIRPLPSVRFGEI